MIIYKGFLSSVWRRIKIEIVIKVHVHHCFFTHKKRASFEGPLILIYFFFNSLPALIFVIKVTEIAIEVCFHFFVFGTNISELKIKKQIYF